MKPIGEEKIVYQGKIVEVVQQQFQAGDEAKTFEWARRAPGTRLIIISPAKKILITKEYRKETENWDYRLPGGKVFDSLAQYNDFLKSNRPMLAAAQEAAKKEAREEVGVETQSMQHVATSKCGSTMEWDLYYFLIDRYVELGKQHLEAGEDIEVGWYGFEQARDLCLNGKIQEDRSVAVLLKWLK